MYFNLIRLSVILLFISSIFFSCKKGQDTSGPTPNLIPVVVKKLDGFLYNGTQGPEKHAMGVTVECAGSKTTTDADGYFRFDNIQVTDETAFIKCTVNAGGSYGAFPMIKSFIPNENGNYIVAELIPFYSFLDKVINSSTGGLSNQSPAGFSVEIPSYAFKNIATNNTFNGNFLVNSNAYSLINSLENFSSNMLYANLQGSLLGLNAAGNEVGLNCLSGLFKIAFRGQNNESLELMPDKKLKMIARQESKSINNNSMPYLWYFSQSKNRWVQGNLATASLIADGATFPRKYYSAEISEFSTDYVFAVPVQLVNLSAKIVSTYNNKPIVNALIRVNKIGEKQLCTIGYTDSAGMITIKIPAQENLELCVLQNCFPSSTYPTGNEEAIYVKSIGTFNSDVNLGVIMAYHSIPNTSSYTKAIVNFQGIAVDCNNKPIQNGCVRFKNRQFMTNAYTNLNGHFNVNMTSDMVSSSWKVFNSSNGDATRDMRSPLFFLPVNMILDTIKVCKSNTAEYINFVIDGVPVNYSVPYLSYYANGGGGFPGFELDEGFKKTTSPTFNIRFGGNFGKGLRPLGFIQYEDKVKQTLNFSDKVFLTENLNSGSHYIAGSFQNVKVIYNDNSIHTFSCDFRLDNYHQ